MNTFTVLSTPTPEGKCSISGCFFFTPGDFLLHPHIRDLEGGRREIRNPPRDLVNTHNKHASPHEILVSRLSAKGGEAKQGGCHFLSSHLTTLQVCFLMTNHFPCLFLAVHACLSIQCNPATRTPI